MRRVFKEMRVSGLALEMNHVCKKFKKGERFDSLKELLPALGKRLLRRERQVELDKKEFWALDDVSLQVQKGEALGIIGRNGAGKSTILKLLTKIMNPTKGTLFTEGRLAALIEIGAGFHGDLTGRENIFLNGTILGMRREEIRKKFDAIVEFSEIEDFIDTPVKRYSSGMFARLGFSVAAHLDPDILVVDEVLSVGDYAFQNKCAKKMKSAVRDGLTVIFVSHNLHAVSEVCQRCVLLEGGRNIREGLTNEVVGYYLNSIQEQTDEGISKEVVISKVALHGENGTGPGLKAGQKVQVEMEIEARAPCKRISVTLSLTDSNRYEIFNTSTERLNGQTLSLESGEKRKILFELDLHLASGTYYVGVYIYRYDIEKMYDARMPFTTLYVTSERDVRGVANLYPVVRIN